jgi:hypothetical protein
MVDVHYVNIRAILRLYSHVRPHPKNKSKQVN